MRLKTTLTKLLKRALPPTVVSAGLSALQLGLGFAFGKYFSVGLGLSATGTTTTAVVSTAAVTALVGAENQLLNTSREFNAEVKEYEASLRDAKNEQPQQQPPQGLEHATAHQLLDSAHQWHRLANEWLAIAEQIRTDGAGLQNDGLELLAKVFESPQRQPQADALLMIADSRYSNADQIDNDARSYEEKARQLLDTAITLDPSLKNARLDELATDDNGRNEVSPRRDLNPDDFGIGLL